MKTKLLTLLFFTTFAFSQIQFENQATQLNIDLPYGIGLFGGGISFFDYNNDGLDDITLSTALDFELLFYKNTGTGFVQDQDINISNGLIQTKQVIWVDIDNDGDNDFFATGYNGISRLFLNSNQNFTDITVNSGLPLDIFRTFGGTWGDYDNDGFLDLFLAIRDDGINEPNRLYHNNGDHTFTDVTQIAGLHNIGLITFIGAFFDYNNDGFQDLYLANDKRELTKNVLYKNNGNGTFTDVSLQSGSDLSMDAMCTTIDDYNNDGWLDIYVSNTDLIVNETTTGNAFLRNNGDGTFTNIAAQNGTQFNSIGWGSVFLDADCDTDHDLYVSSSRNGTEPENTISAAFYENDGFGNYTIPQNVGFQNDEMYSFSNAIGDVDNDGYPEIAVLNNFNEPISLWKNLCPQDNNWLKVKLQGTTSNKMGIGSWIEISVNSNKQFHYTLCGEGYIAQNSAYEFFGLGQETIVDYVKVTWLSGMVDYLENVSINQAVTIIEGQNPLSENEIELNKITAYPNPTTNHLNITNQNNLKIKIELFTNLGVKIQEKNSSNKNIKIDLNEFASGIYLVKLKTKYGIKTIKLLIK